MCNQRVKGKMKSFKYKKIKTFTARQLKYKVKKIAKGAKGCEVTITDLADNTEKILQ